MHNYWNNFQLHHHNRTDIAFQYIEGLLTLEKGKANIERMEEEIPESEYRAYQHFISKSNWDHQGVIDKVSLDASELMRVNKSKTKKLTGCIIDESAHLKKGEKSVGVAKQYAGVVGKVENCQVGVYASLVNDTRAALVGELFLPESWTRDKNRCKAVHIPMEERTYKTKPELALEIIDRLIGQGVEFDWIGGDGLYGHSGDFRKGLDQRGQFFVLDIHKDEKVFLQQPTFSIPRRNGRGRPFKHQRPDFEPIRLDKYLQGTKDDHNQ